MFLPWRHRRCLKADPCLQRHLTVETVKSNVDASFSLHKFFDQSEIGRFSGNPDATFGHAPAAAANGQRVLDDHELDGVDGDDDDSGVGSAHTGL
jgi:hypothetical protein